MKFVYILEDDPRFQKEICEAIVSIDPKIQIRIFPQLENFVNWIRLMMSTGPGAIAMGGNTPEFVSQDPVSQGEEHQLVMVLAKVEFLGAKQLELMKKTRKLFIDRKICTAEDPTAFVLTAFDNPDFPIKELENRILNNVIFKPFDRLILTQHLTFAIDGRHPPSKYTVVNQKTTAVVEMLKEVEMESLSDVGFTTKSYRPIEPGAISKYYSSEFLSDRQRSLFGICRSCVPHPKDPKNYLCTFHFFAADQTQISNLRKRTRAKEEVQLPFAGGLNVPPRYDVQVILMDPEEDTANGLRGMISNLFTGVEVNSYPSFAALLSDLDPGAALSQRDASLKTLGGANKVTLHFDLGGTTFMECESDKADLYQLFGVALSDWKDKGNWFAQAVLSEHRDRYWRYVQSARLADDNILPLLVKEVLFLVQVAEIRKESGKFSMTLVEPSKDEQCEWLKKHSKLNKPVHLIIASHQFCGEGAKERWTFVKEALKNKFQTDAQIVVTTKREFSDTEEKNLGSVVQDIFFKPVDRVYFGQKLKCLLPFLKESSDPIEIKNIKKEAIIKTANPVKIEELSEAGFVMTYYRAIAIGSFREMVLWQPYEVGAPELVATCNFVEESQAEKGAFKCHFVFFGAHDHFLKHIRIWIRDNYVLSKEGQS